MEGKVCTKCGIFKDLGEYHKHSGMSDGRRPSCKECRKLDTKKYIEENKDKISSYSKKYYLENKDYIKSKTKRWKRDNPERVRHLQNKRKKERLKEDILFCLKERLRRRISHAFNNVGWEKGNSRELLGGSYKIIRKHIESLFKDEMSWNNRNKWEIDHKIPLSAANNKEELKILCHYTNLQPLWTEDNKLKGGKYKKEDFYHFKEKNKKNP